VLIREDRLEKVLERYSSHKLFYKALDRGWDFVTTLFSTRSDDLNEPQLTIGSTSLKTSYVDWNGQLHAQALHFAVIAQDYNMIQFLHEMGQDINKLADFPALFSKHPTDSNCWELYVSRRFGPPLTAAVNRYVRSRHVLQEDKQKAEIINWRKMIQELIKLGADWSKFADGEELLGPQPAFRADAPSVLWHAIDCDDRIIYGLILEAKPPLDFEWLPWKPFFETEKWWTPFTPPRRSLKEEDAKRVIEVLRNDTELALPNGEETLKSSITRIMWEKIEDLHLSPSAVNTLFEQLMAQVATWRVAKSEEQQKTVVQQLEVILRANPKPESWVKQTESCSVLHFCVAQNLYDVLKLFLEDGKSAAFINYNFADGDSLLDKAECCGSQAMVQLLKLYKAMPAQRTCESYTPAESIRTTPSRMSSKSPRFMDAPRKRSERLTITTQAGYGLVTPPGSRQLTPFSPASSKLGNLGTRSGRTTPIRAVPKARSTPRPRIATFQAESTFQVCQEDISHYSDSEFQFGFSKAESPTSFQSTPQETAHPTPSGLSPTAQLSDGVFRPYSAALKDGLDPNIQWAAPRPKLPLGRNSFQNAEVKSRESSSSISQGPRGRAGTSSRIGRGRGESRVREK